MKCAIVEYNYYHDQTLPTLVYALNKLGFGVDVFTAKRAIRNNIFASVSGLDYSLRSSDGLRFRLWEVTGQYRGYEFLLVNSIEPKSRLFRVSKLSIPTVALVHNGELVTSDADYFDFFSHGNRKPLVPTRHSASFLSQRLHTRWFAPVLLGEPTKRRRPEEAGVRLCVSGNIEFVRRNYHSLLDAVQQLVAEGTRGFRIIVAGKNDWPDGIAFRARVEEAGLVDFFEYTSGELKYRDFFDLIASTQFVLPLLDRTSPVYASYFLSKMASSIPMAIGFGIVPVIHREQAALYGIEDVSIVYEDGGLVGALGQALRMDSRTLDAMRRRLVAKREALLDQSTVNIRETLRELLGDARVPALTGTYSAGINS